MGRKKCPTWSGNFNTLNWAPKLMICRTYKSGHTHTLIDARSPEWLWKAMRTWQDNGFLFCGVLYSMWFVFSQHLKQKLVKAIDILDLNVPLKKTLLVSLGVCVVGSALKHISLSMMHFFYVDWGLTCLWFLNKTHTHFLFCPRCYFPVTQRSFHPFCLSFSHAVSLYLYFS